MKFNNKLPLKPAQGTISTLVMSLVLPYIENIKDIKVLMLLSSFWRRYFFTTKGIMKNIVVNFEGFTDTRSATQLNKRNGKYFESVSIRLNINLDQFLLTLLKRAKNLKELTIDDLNYNDSDNLDSYKYKIIKKVKKLPRLLYLNIGTISSLKSFISCTVKVTTLKSLNLDFCSLDCPIILTNFIRQQTCLKYLSIKILSSNCIPIFPTDVTFKLEELSIEIEKMNIENLLTFLATQKGLKRFKIDGNYHEKDLENIFGKIDCLENLTIGKDIKDDFYVHIESLRHFEDERYTSNAAKINAKYPSLKTLKVQSLIVGKIVSFLLTKIRFEFGCFWELKNIQFENLQEVEFHKLPRLDGSFNDFINNISRVKFIIIESLTSSNDYVLVMDKIRSFKYLKIFKLQHKNNSTKIDVESQQISLSKQIMENFSEIYKLLQICYPKFEFIEICYDKSDLQSRRLDPYYLQNKNVRIIPFENEAKHELVKLLKNPFDKNSSTQTILVTIGGCLKELYIRDLPFDNVGENALKYMIEEMKLETFYYGKIPLILNGEKQKLNELTLSGIQMSSIYEMFRQYPTVSKLRFILNNDYIISSEVERVSPQNIELFKNLKEVEIIDASNYRRAFGVYLHFYKNFKSIESLKIKTPDRNIKVLLQEFLPVMSNLEELLIDSLALCDENRFDIIENLVPNVKKLNIMSNRGQSNQKDAS